MLCFWNTRKNKHTHNKNKKVEAENSELACKHLLPESKLKSTLEHNQGTAQGMVLSQLRWCTLGKGSDPPLPPPPRLYNLQFFVPRLENKSVKWIESQEFCLPWPFSEVFLRWSYWQWGRWGCVTPSPECWWYQPGPGSAPGMCRPRQWVSQHWPASPVT